MSLRELKTKFYFGRPCRNFSVNMGTIIQAIIQNRFNDARKFYNNEKVRRKRTGEPTEEPKVQGIKQWYWSEDMHFIMAKDISTNPHVTIAAGSCNRRVVRPVIGEEDVIGNHPDDPDSEQSAGSSNHRHVGDKAERGIALHYPGSQQSQAADVGRTGKGRVPLLRRPSSKKDAKEAAVYANVAALNRQTDVLANHFGVIILFLDLFL